MDAIDVRILREIGRNQPLSPFPTSVASLRSLARRVGVDKETVRKRLKGLRDRKILLGWHAMINPSAISLKASRVWVEFSSEASKRGGLKKLAALPSSRVVYDYAGNVASFVFASRRDEQSRLVDELVGTSPSMDVILVATMRFPPARATPSETDWRIYECIRTNPQKPRATIAREAGLGVRTVKRRLAYMTHGSVILVAPDSDPSRVRGVSADLLVRYDVAESVEAELVEEIVDSVIHVEFFEESCAVFTVLAGSVSEAMELLSRVRNLPGIRGAELYFVHGLVQVRRPIQPRNSAGFAHAEVGAGSRI